MGVIAGAPPTRFACGRDKQVSRLTKCSHRENAGPKNLPGASKDCAVALWGLVPYFDLRICHTRLVYWRVSDLLAPLICLSLSCLAI
jgi:hypothetical protein